MTSTREGLFLAASIATGPSRKAPLALMQNPFYQTYHVAAIMAGAEPRYLRHSGFPEFAVDLGELDAATLSRTSILYLCSPSNPDGRVVPTAAMRRAIEAARRHDFLVVFDECYAELYDDAPPQGALDVLAAIDSSERWLDNVLVLHSLSKRSSAAGMRSGFAVGPKDVIAALNLRAAERHRVHAAAAARRGDGALVGGHPRRRDARAPAAAQGHGGPSAGAASRLLPSALRLLPVDPGRRRRRARRSACGATSR